MSDPVEEMAEVLYQAASGWRPWDHFRERGMVECEAREFRAAAGAALAHSAAQQAGLVEALRKCEARFDEYAKLHAAKPDMEKAKRNSDMADMIRAELAKVTP